MTKRDYFIELPNRTTYKNVREMENNLIIEDLIKVKYRSKNDFIIQVIDIFISKLSKDIEGQIDYTHNDYLKYRGVFSQLPNDFIENNKDFIIKVISANSKELRQYVKKLSDTNNFSFSIERKPVKTIKVEVVNGKKIKREITKYKIKKRIITDSDILLYAKEIHSQIGLLLTSILNTTKTDIYKFKELIQNNEEIARMITEQYEKEFGYLKDLEIDMITELYNSYKGKLLNIITSLINTRINSESRKKLENVYWDYVKENKVNYLVTQAKKKQRGGK